MKKTLFALLVLAATATVATAQTTTAPSGAVTTTGSDANQNARHNRTMGKGGHKSPAQQADHHAAKMAKQLGLTADQQAKVAGVLLAQNQEMTALKAKYAGSRNRQTLRPEAEAIRGKYDAQLQAALGAEAYARYDKMRAEHHDKRKHEHGPRDGRMKM